MYLDTYVFPCDERSDGNINIYGDTSGREETHFAMSKGDIHLHFLLDNVALLELYEAVKLQVEDAGLIKGKDTPDDSWERELSA